MDNSLYLLAASMDVASKNYERLAHNIANVQTPGFKEMLSQVESQKSSKNDKNPMAQLDFPYLKVKQSFTQGALENTGNPMDVAISGNGFIAIKEENGESYLRSGSFAISNEGFLTTNDGRKVLGTDGPIVIDPENSASIQIDQQGNVRFGDEIVGRLKVVAFENPEQLQLSGGSYRNLSKAKTQEATDSTIHQGALEKSTVDSIRSSTDLIANVRYLGAIQKVMNVIDEGSRSLMREVSE